MTERGREEKVNEDIGTQFKRSPNYFCLWSGTVRRKRRRTRRRERRGRKRRMRRTLRRKRRGRRPPT